MEEAGVASLVISLVVNISTLICPLLGHPGQLVVPDLGKHGGGETVGVGTLMIITYHWAHTPGLRLLTGATGYLASHLQVTSFLNFRHKNLDIFF